MVSIGSKISPSQIDCKSNAMVLKVSAIIYGERDDEPSAPGSIVVNVCYWAKERAKAFVAVE